MYFDFLERHLVLNFYKHVAKTTGKKKVKDLQTKAIQTVKERKYY